MIFGIWEEKECRNIMDELIRLIENNEDWLVDTVIEYAKAHGYAKYSSTLREAWRLSIVGLSSSLINQYEMFRDIPFLGPDDNFEGDILTSFGITEAKRHRERGVSLTMFLGLMKYYKQSYIDLICMKCEKRDLIETYRLFTERCFDRIEIAFCNEWTQNRQDILISELQAINRLMTNEKNVYLTLFESQFDPTIILSQENEIVNLNHAAANLIDSNYKPGEIYYQAVSDDGFNNRQRRESNTGFVIGSPIEVYFPWIEEILKERKCDPTSKISREARLTDAGKHTYHEVTCSPILDISDQLRGSILTLRDITARKQAESALKQSY